MGLVTVLPRLSVLTSYLKIVDGLSSYKQPVFVYIIPNGELVRPISNHSASPRLTCIYSEAALGWFSIPRLMLNKWKCTQTSMLVRVS